EWSEVSSDVDEQQVSHIRVEQKLAGYPIHGQDMILHIRNGQVKDLNGFAWTGSTPAKIPDPVSISNAMETSREYLKGKGIKFQSIPSMAGIANPEDKAELVWFPKD